MKKIFLILLFSVFSVYGYAQSNQVNIGEYLYPYMSFVYSLNPDENGNSQYTNTYKMEHNGQILTRLTEQWQSLYTNNVGIMNFYVTIDPDNPNAIISPKQVSRSYDGTFSVNDSITMFILPEGNKELKWIESKHSGQTSCTAKNIYLSFTLDGKPQYRKAVKIEKSWTADNKKYHQTSYWCFRLSRLITFVEIDGAKPIVTEKLISFKIRDIKEVSEEEYNNNK